MLQAPKASWGHRGRGWRLELLKVRRELGAEGRGGKEEEVLLTHAL
jgi:hypothetical protein